MKETIIKGTGNSRSIRSVPNFATLYPTWESYRDAMAADGVPVDIGALNEAGCSQIGDGLNKATLLKDATAALYNKTSNATPDDIFADIRLIIQQVSDNGTKVITGSFAGTGELITLSLARGWQVVFLIGYATSSSDMNDTKSIHIIFRPGPLLMNLYDYTMASINTSMTLVRPSGNITDSTVDFQSSTYFQYSYVAIG